MVCYGHMERSFDSSIGVGQIHTYRATLDILFILYQQVDQLNRAQAISLTREFSSIKQNAVTISDRMVWVDQGLVQRSGGNLSNRSQYLEIYRGYLSQAKDLLNIFNTALEELPERELPIRQISPTTPVRSYLREIIVGCEKVLGYMQAFTGNLSGEENERLMNFASDARRACHDLKPNFGSDIEYATKAIENGQFLGSALILGKVISHAFDQIDGKSIEEKVDSLSERGIIEKTSDGLRQRVIEASNRAGAYLSLQRDIVPSSSEVLSLFEDCIYVLKLFSDYLKSGSGK